MTKMAEEDSTNIAVKFKFDDKWIYASVTEQLGMTDGMIVLGTDY